MDKHLVLLPSIQNDESFRKKAQLQDISQQSHPSVTPISPFMTFVQSAHPVCFQSSAPPQQWLIRSEILLLPHKNPLTWYLLRLRTVIQS